MQLPQKILRSIHVFLVLSVFLLSCVVCRFSLANQTYIWRPGVGIILDFLESNRFSSSALFFLFVFTLAHLLAGFGATVQC